SRPPPYTNRILCRCERRGVNRGRENTVLFQIGNLCFHFIAALFHSRYEKAAASGGGRDGQGGIREERSGSELTQPSRRAEQFDLHPRVPAAVDPFPQHFRAGMVDMAKPF